MEQREQAAGGGWPLGLHPMNAAAAARVSMTSVTSTFLVSTPSLTSFSSSDLDTESTGSFFPEKSTTLGSLIGIQSSSQLAIVEGDTSSTEGDPTSGKRKRGHSRSRTCWSMLTCGGSLRDGTLEVSPSPSLAHFLGRERRESLSRRQNSQTDHSHVGQGQGGQEPQEDAEDHRRRQEQEARFDFDRFVPRGSGLYNNAHTSTSQPCAPTIGFILQHPSPTHYLSTDWNVYSDLSQNPEIRGHSSSGHGRFHTLWPSRCCRMSTGVAN